MQHTRGVYLKSRHKTLIGAHVPLSSKDRPCGGNADVPQFQPRLRAPLTLENDLHGQNL